MAPISPQHNGPLNFTVLPAQVLHNDYAPLYPTPGLDLVKYTACIGSTSMRGVAILDKGSTTNVISRSMLTDSRFASMASPFSGQCNGISGSVNIVGQLKCDTLKIGDRQPIMLENVLFNVIEGDCPVLLGQSILGEVNSQVIYDYESMTVKSRSRSGELLQFDLTTMMDSMTHFGSVVPQVNMTSLCEPNSEVDRVDWALKELGVVIGGEDAEECAHKRRQMASLFYEFRDCFGGGDQFGKFPVKVSIPTEGSPIRCKPRTVPHHYQAKCEAEIERLLKLGVVEFCSDSRGWLSPIHVVPKKNGDIRLVVDFKQGLNRRITGEEAFPAPCIDDVLHSIRPGHKHFSGLDLESGYWQLEIQECDRYKTAFSFNGKVYQYTRCPMGMKHSGASFNKAVSMVLEYAQIDPDRIKCYVDDLCIMDSNFDRYLEGHKKLFSALRYYNFKVKPSKCMFLQSEVTFLGSVISPEGRRPDPSLVQGFRDLDYKFMVL